MTSAAILAGGRARRFSGRDKSRIPIAGRPILARQLEALRDVAHRVFLVGAPPGTDLPAGVACLPDRIADRGPLGGLDAALSAAGDDAVLLLACDMPNVTAPLLSCLVAELGDADAVVPKTEHGYHPLCAVYARSCREPVQRRLERGQLRMQDLLAELRVRSIDAAMMAPFGEAGYLLANVNSQADLDALESLQDH